MAFQITDNMKKCSIPVIFVCILLTLATSCYYDNEEALYPSLKGTCDTLNVTYSGSVAVVLSNYCYSCHSNANAAFGGGVRLQSVADVITNASKIQAAIKHTGLKPMPPSGKLNDCSVSQFDIWVKNGMPDN